MFDLYSLFVSFLKPTLPPLPLLTGCMIPYSMRLLHTQLPLYTGNAQLAMNRTCLLQHGTRTVLHHIKEKKRLPFLKELLSEEDQRIAEEIWTKRLVHVKCILGNSLLRMKVKLNE